MVPEIQSMTDKNFCHLRPFFALFPPNYLKNKNFEKLKKMTRDIIILQMCTTNDNHIIYGSWDMECSRQNFLSFWTIFCPFPSLTKQKIKILIKWKKKSGEIIVLYMCTINVCFLRYRAQQTEFFVIWTIFCPFTPLTTQKIKILKK